MSDSTISNLPPASTPLTGGEVIPLDQGGVTKKTLLANVVCTVGNDVASALLYPLLTNSTTGVLAAARVSTPNYTFNATTGVLSALGFFAGVLSYSDTGVLGQFSGSGSGYEQVIVQNKTSGVGASADVVVSNDIGTATTTYGDFGINSSVFSGVGSLGLPSATYLTATGGDLVLGTTTNNVVRFVLNMGSADTATLSATNLALAVPVNKVAITAPATGATLTIADTKTLTVNNSLTLAGTDGTTMTFPTVSSTIPSVGDVIAYALALG